MKVVILAGGRGTRFYPDTEIKPKPMIEIGGIPIIQHIINYYKLFGYEKFLVLAGYLHEKIEEYFNDIPGIEVIDTGMDSGTGGRLLQVADKLNDFFMLTYGDGLSNVDLNELYFRHTVNKAICTLTAVHPPGRFGTLMLNGDSIVSYDEKQRLREDWVNGGYMMFSPSIFKYIEPNEMMEFSVFPRLVRDGSLYAYRHNGFWQPMDTSRDREYLEEVWKSKRCPWRDV